MGQWMKDTSEMKSLKNMDDVIVSIANTIFLSSVLKRCTDITLGSKLFHSESFPNSQAICSMNEKDILIYFISEYKVENGWMYLTSRAFFMDSERCEQKFGQLLQGALCPHPVMQ